MQPDDASQTLSPQEAAQLVDEENKEIDEALTMIPPEMRSDHRLFPFKKKAQSLMMSSGTAGVLEQVCRFKTLWYSHQFLLQYFSPLHYQYQLVMKNYQNYNQNWWRRLCIQKK